MNKQLSYKSLNQIKPPTSKSGFTIVELLVVIVVIGILAAITIVSYSGVTRRAVVATLESDLANSSKRLEIYNALYGSYPTALDANHCPTAPTVDSNYCLKPSTNNTFSGYSSTGTSFSLTETNANGLVYMITNGLSPYNITPTPVEAIASITGTTQISQTLTAGPLTPAAATVNYQWQSAATAGGVYSNIPGATASTYVVPLTLVGKYIRVVVTGTGIYSGTQTSPASTVIAADANWQTIGTQTWAKANMNVGTMVTGGTTQPNDAAVQKYCYGNSAASCAADGALYQWGEAMQYATAEGSQGICPADSHIPSDTEWKTLEKQLGMSQVQADISGGWRITNAEGTQLKPGGASGLNIPLMGDRSTDGSFYYATQYGYLWTSTQAGSEAYLRYLANTMPEVYRGVYDKAYGFAIRCVVNSI